jgi:hypothetical protein
MSLDPGPGAAVPFVTTPDLALGPRLHTAISSTAVPAPQPAPAPTFDTQGQEDQFVGATPVNEPPKAEQPNAAGYAAGQPPETWQAKPGDVVLPSRVRLSLSRLFRLEEELAQFLGPENVVVDVLEDGRTVIHVPAELEQRTRDYLALSGEMNESEGGNG